MSIIYDVSLLCAFIWDVVAAVQLIHACSNFTQKIGYLFRLGLYSIKFQETKSPSNEMDSSLKERERKCFIDGAFATMNDTLYLMIKRQQSEAVSSSLLLIFFILLLLFWAEGGAGGPAHLAFTEGNDAHSASVSS